MLLLPDNSESSHSLSQVTRTSPMDSSATFGNMTGSSTLPFSSNINEFRYQVYPTTYSIVSVLGFTGNGFVLWVLVRAYREKTAFQVFMLNLAISDLLFVCTLPLRIAYYVNRGNWLFGDFLCRVSSYTIYVNLYCSILFMTAMSFFRCIAIVFPLQNLRFVTERKARLVCVAIWVFVTLVTSPFLLKGVHRDEATNMTKCLEPPQTGQMRKVLVMHYIALFIGFVLPFVVIVICCSLIIRTLLRSAFPRRGTARRKAIWMVIIVAATFLMSFTPYHVQRTIHIHFLMRTDSSPEDTLYMQKSVVITLSLAAFNCCFDPLLYFFSGESFRSRLSTLRSNSVLSGSRDRPPATPC